MESQWQKTTYQGFVAGLIGFAVTALMYSVANVVQGHSPFYTAATLGAALIYGVRDPAQVVVTPAYVFAYNGAHLFVFLGLGTLGSWLARLADRGEQLWYVALFFFAFACFHLIALLQVVAAPVRSLVSDTSIWLAGITAAVLMVAYLLRVHPAIRARQPW